MKNQTKYIIGGAALLGFITLFLGLNYGPSASNNLAAVGSSDLVATNGIHWHPMLEIVIDGEVMEIPTGIGLTGGHDPMHTHESDGTVHLEYPQFVTQEDTTLGRFFEVWGKKLSATSVLDYDESEGDQISFTVNDQEIIDPVNYQFSDGETIKIEVQTNQT